LFDQFYIFFLIFVLPSASYHFILSWAKEEEEEEGQEEEKEKIK
jgi:hypothetical protein